MIGFRDGLCTSSGKIIDSISNGVFHARQADLSETSCDQRLKSELETPTRNFVSNDPWPELQTSYIQERSSGQELLPPFHLAAASDISWFPKFVKLILRWSWKWSSWCRLISRSTFHFYYLQTWELQDKPTLLLYCHFHA